MDNFICLDCSVNTSDIDEYYMVRDAVWYKAVAAKDRHRMLCVGCLEARLGRQLVPSDFIWALINDPTFFDHSERLRNRIGS